MNAKECLIKAYENQFGTQRYIDSNIHYTFESVVLDAMKKYASIKCKEQREICANTITLGYFVDDDAEKRGNDHIRNAPEPTDTGQ